MALKGSPTVLLLLFVDGDDVIEREPFGYELQALAPAFVSRRTGRAFLGYAAAQRRGLLVDRHGTPRRELSAAYGYDAKYAMHALRIAHQGVELLSTGRITLPVAEAERERLMQVRRGEIALSDMLDRLHTQSMMLERLVLDANLPPDSDHEAVDRCLSTAYQEHGHSDGPIRRKT